MENFEQDLIKIRNNRDVSFTDLYSIDQVSLDDMALIFDVARQFRKYKTYKFSLNKGCSQVNLFFENSTRTMSSFDLSAKNLSMDTTWVSSWSSVKKWESYLDTVQTLDSYNVKVIVIRTSESGVPEVMARHTQASIINAWDWWHEHPTQALLDALTMLDHFEAKDLKWKVVCIVWDIMHSRVFGSLVRILKKLWATVRVSAPQTFIPSHAENFGIEIHYNVEKALKDADVVYALRVQEERWSKWFIPTLREYSKMYWISRKRLDIAKQDAILMHPGPVIRDIDVHSALSAVDSQSHILQQVENGMAVRKTLLWLLCDRYDKKVKNFKRK